MAKKKEIDPVFLLDFLNSIEDPRIDRTKKHSLETIMIIAICAAICGAIPIALEFSDPEDLKIVS